MYHRIAKPDSDIWKIAVDPVHFEQQIEFLRKKTTVLSVPELVEAVRNKTVKSNTVAITFDDGYADNFLVAKPILDQYEVPATFFVTSKTIGSAAEFWWDELENILLFTPQLPATFSMTVAGKPITSSLEQEASLSDTLRQQFQRWDASDEPAPSRRASLFLAVWQQLRPLPYAEQQQCLHAIRAWAGLAPSQRPDCRAMSVEELRALAGSTLHTIGLHTHTHPALAFHAAEVQQHEIQSNRIFLEKETGRSANILAYPYGNHNQETITVAAELNLQACFTTEAKLIDRNADKFRLGRFQVKNSPLSSFAQQLRKWQKS
jgi:peptidoglycan/xylan/chitin deacetylase (PgdA/CDA1 family)